MSNLIDTFQHLEALHELTHDEEGRVLPDEAVDPEDIEQWLMERRMCNG